MYIVSINRSDLFKCLPKNKIIGEIGTAEGIFATAIYNNANPKSLHLIDPWEFQDRDDYLCDTNNVSQEQANQRYDNILSSFAPMIKDGSVHIHRAFSPAAAELFKDGYFDYIYIDGMHTEEAVYADLQAFDAKTKPDGLIIGHDYVAHSSYRAMNFGVIEAVNQFVKETGYEFTLLTCEGSPSYVLSKNDSSHSRNYLISTIMQFASTIIEVKNAENKIMQQLDIVSAEGKLIRNIISFD